MKLEGKYLITINKNFYAEDGKMYNAIWGEVIHNQNTLTVGKDEKCIQVAVNDTIAILKCDNVPVLEVDVIGDLGHPIYKERNSIYIID